MELFSDRAEFHGIDGDMRKKVESGIDCFIKKLETELRKARETNNYDWFLSVMREQRAFLNSKNTKRWITHLSLLDDNYLEKIKDTAKQLLELYLFKERSRIEPKEIALALIYIAEATGEGVFPGWFIRYESGVSDLSLKKTKDRIVAQLETYKAQESGKNYNLTKQDDRRSLAAWISYLVKHDDEILKKPHAKSPILGRQSCSGYSQHQKAANMALTPLWYWPVFVQQRLWI